MDKITVLIPVYNEKESVLELVKKVEETDLGLEKEIILIDDCSTDGTRELYPKINQYIDEPDSFASDLVSFLQELWADL